jgi:hypothetical protein
VTTESKLFAPKVIVMGPAGTGKTHSLGTLVDSGVEVFYLAIESGLESLLGYWTDVRPDNPRPRAIPPNLHWHKIDPAKVSFKELAEYSTKVNTLSLESLAKMVDLNRHMHNLFTKILESMNNFHDDRTGQDFGPVDEWGTDRAIVIDGLTGISKAAMALVTGGKPVKSQSDYQLAMNQIENFLRLCCDHCPCWFVLIAHVEREVDEVLGGVKITVSSLGRKLPPLIPPMFSDVILAVREGTRWSWDTTSSQADTKARNLPWASGLKPDFGQIVKTWQTRSTAAETPPAA